MCNDSSLEAVADSGTTGHYITPTTPCTNKQTATQLIPIKMPNGDIITSSHIALLPQHNSIDCDPFFIKDSDTVIFKKGAD